MMRFHGIYVLGLLYGARSIAAKGYADNQAKIVKDEPHVAANFPDVNIELLSPAFLSPETVPAGFADGTAAPTNQTILGRSIRPRLSTFNDPHDHKNGTRNLN